MKIFIVTLFALMAYASAVPEEEVTPIPILNQAQELNPDGSYSFSYEGGNGVSQSAKATMEKIDDKLEALVVEGRYSYIDENGVEREVTYRADKDGYHPSADFLPVPPPVPEAIQRALDYAAAHPEPTPAEPESA